MKTIKIGKGLKLPAEDFLESAIAVLGKRGRGKSGGVKVILEELVHVGLPFIAFDPVGVMWGIKSSADGTKPGLPVLVVGGSHGDIKLDRHAGALVARSVVQANVSCVVDFSEEPKSAYREFVRDFSHELFRINDTPRMVIIEEAPELVPQKLRPDMGEVFEAVERLVSRGRNKGIGVILVSQRAATINKDVLTQVDGLFIFGLAAPQDKDAIKEWVEAKADPQKLSAFIDGLQDLPRQEAWFWAPEAFGGEIFQRVHVRNFHTFHPDKTHLRRAGLLEAKPVTTDVSSLVQKLGKDMERLRQVRDEVKELPRLRAEVEKLKRQRDEAVQIAAQEKERAPSPREISKAVNAAVAEQKEAAHEFQRELAFLRKALEKVKAAVEGVDLDKQLVSAMRALPPRPVPPVTRAEARKLNWPTRTVPAPSPLVVAAGSAPDDPDGEPQEFSAKKAHIKILFALSRLHGLGVERPTKTQVALWSGYSPTSGGYANYLGMMRSAGLVEYGGDTTMFLTDEGRKLVDSQPNSPEIPASTDELREQIYRMVGGSRAKILRVLVDVHPNGISKPDLAQQCDPPFSPTSGGYANYLGSLRSMGLIDYVGGQVVATEVLFL